MSFTDTLLHWHHTIDRKLPWKDTLDPYKIWLSEIILQQTRVEQGTPYYLKFIEAYPTIHDLADSSLDEVMAHWAGLGYYSRARNMHKAAQYVSSELGGEFPSTHTDIMALSGVGPYTAAAIASFAFELPHPVVDGNVIRFISRYLGLSLRKDDPLLIREIRSFLTPIIEKTTPSVFNQALMDFGSLFCKPKNPDCRHCFFKDQCQAYTEGRVSEIPLPKKKIKRRSRYFHYLLLEVKDEILMTQREEKDIWQDLHEPPMIESKEDHVLDRKPLLAFLEINTADVEVRPMIEKRKQVLSHQDIYASFYRVMINKKEIITLKTGWKWVKKVELQSIGKPRIVDLYFEDKSITLFS